MTQATWCHITPRQHRATRLPHEWYHWTWHDSFMSHAMCTGTTQRGQILEISFGLVHFSNFFIKRPKYKTNSKCAYLIPRGPIYRAVKGLNYIVQTAPSCPTFHAEYIVMGSLQSFMIYNYFYAKPIPS
jgi:hypothetical protein